MTADPKSWRGLYAIIDAEACGERPPEEVAAEVLAGGCAVLQLRAKRISQAERRKMANAILPLCRSAGIPFVINDDVALTRELGADGVHLGRGDMPITDARSFARNACIGLSAHSLEQAREAERLGADLIGFGPVFATTSKLNADPVVGVRALAELVTQTRTPIVAIGGIDLSTIDQVADTRVQLVACIAAICKASDPRAAAAALHERIKRR
jgi:thiamine-phosphate pyrophosphorylase